MRLKELRQSITVQLVGSAVVSLIVAVVGAVVVELHTSTRRIDAEMRSGVELADTVVRRGLDGVDRAPDTDAAARDLVDDIRHVRHIAVEYTPFKGHPVGGSGQIPASASPLPSWVLSLFRPPVLRNVYAVTAGGAPHGTIVVTGRADDEIAEIWGELRSQVLWLGITASMITVAMIGIARHAMRPIEAVADGMDRLSHGEFIALTDSDVYELHQIHDRFNVLSGSLQQVNTNNRLLIDRMITLQESEREDIARELHDEIGAALFSLRAELVAWRHPGSGDDAHKERINGLEAIIEDIQWRNGQILAHLRPTALDHLPLADALRDLIAAWRGRVRHICWISDIEDCLDGVGRDAALAVYRVVQECLTNAARHSRARQVNICLRSVDGTVRIDVSDNGVGPGRGIQMGYGLLGATERVRKLRGSLRIRQNQPRGLAVSVTLPGATDGVPGATGA